MSAARRRRKAAHRRAAHAAQHPTLCPRCQQPGQHFAVPAGGQSGSWLCTQVAALRDLTSGEAT